MAKRRAPSRQRAQAKEANSRRRRKRRTGRKVIHYTLLVLFVLAAGAVLSVTTFFKVKEIRVVGSDKYLPAQIASASGIGLEESLLRVDTQQVRDNLLAQFPYIETVIVRRKLPPAVEIQVTQSMPAAALLEEDEVVLITKEGKVLERGDVFIPPDIPVVKGLGAKGVAPGQTIGEDSKEGLRMLGYLFDALAGSQFTEVTNVDITDPLNMKIVYENRLLLLLGTEADLPYKLDMLWAVIQDKPPDAQGRIDATNVKDKKAIYKKITLQEALALESGKQNQGKTTQQSQTEGSLSSGEDSSG